MGAADADNKGMSEWVTRTLDKLPPAFLLVAVLVAVSLYLFLGAKPPQVWPACIIAVVAIILAFGAYFLDQKWKDEKIRRKDEEAKRREAEGSVRELRHLVEEVVPKGAEQRDSWTRPMLQTPLPETINQNILQIFDITIEEATFTLRSFVEEVDSSKVRANLFLPTSEGVHVGDVCNLVIPLVRNGADPNDPASYLQRNMEDHLENAIRFRPGQGATGRVFVQSYSVGVLTHPSWLCEIDEQKKKQLERWVYVHLHPTADYTENGKGKSVYTEKGKIDFQMTDFLNRRIEKSLAWIISMPILSKINGSLEVIGVFNVDCLEYQIKPEQLRAIYYRIIPFAGVLAGALKGLPTDRVAIFRFKE